MTDEKKTPTILTVSVGGSVPTEKVFGPPDPRYKNGGEAAAIAIAVQQKIAAMWPAVDLSVIGSVDASAFAPSTLAQPNKTFGKYSLERPPLASVSANLDLLATWNHDPATGGVFAAGSVGVGLRKSYQLARGEVERAKNAALSALEKGIQQKEAAAAAIEAGRRQLQAGQEEYANGIAVLEAGRAEFAVRTEALNAGSARLAAEQLRLDEGRATFAAQQQLLEQKQTEFILAQQQFEAARNQLAPLAKVNPAVAQQLAAQEEVLRSSASILSGSQAQLQEGAVQLAASEAQLAQGRAQLATAEQQLSAGQVQIVQGETQLAQLLKQITEGENRLSAAEAMLAGSPALPGLQQTRSQLDAATFVDKGLKPYGRGFVEVGASVPIGNKFELQAAGVIAGEIGADTHSRSTGLRVAIGSAINGLPKTVHTAAGGSGITYTQDPEATEAGAFKLEATISKTRSENDPYVPGSLTNPDTKRYGIEAAWALGKSAIISTEYGCQNNPSSGVPVPPNLGITADKGPSKHCSGKVAFTTRF